MDPRTDPSRWFKNWEWTDGSKLSAEHIKRLVKLTKNWSRQTENSAQNLRDWTEDPNKFWGFEPFRTEAELVRYCLEHSSSDEKAHPARRRVLLVILHDIIDKETMRLKTLKQHLNTKHTTTAVKNILEQAYHGNPSKELRDKCTRLNRFGKRWASLPQREWVLAPFEHAIEELVLCCYYASFY